MKRVIIFGGKGLIGLHTAGSLQRKGYDTVIVSRGTKDITGLQEEYPGIDFANWNYTDTNAGIKLMNGAFAVINFTGASIAGNRLTEQYKKEVYDSRIETTRIITQALISCVEKPEILINASATGYYGSRGEEILTESASAGNDFLADLCKNWEKETSRAEKAGVRTILLRSGVVLSRKGGALETMSKPFKMFLGGKLGSGKQWFPWIHIDDVAGIIVFALENATVSGAVNAAAPNPVTNGNFSRELARTLGRPCLFTVPRFALKIAAGELGDFLLASQRAVPEKMIKLEYKFRFESAREALNDLLKL